MEVITKKDLILINELSARSYSGNKLLSNANQNEKDNLKAIKEKLKEIAEYHSKKYNESYGGFDVSVSTGNDIAIGGTALKRIWAGLFKGADNKQYAAQISFVMNPTETCLDVGFYFGRAAGHSKNNEQRLELERNQQNLAISLSKILVNNKLFREKYESLFDFGFKAYADGSERQSDEWIDIIKYDVKSSHICAKIFPNDLGIIEHSTIDLYVAQIIFLMGGIYIENSLKEICIEPLTPEQRAKQAHRKAEIGLKGELFVMEEEKKKLSLLGIQKIGYPKHVALESMHYGYDILSLDESGNEIYIEVKATTRLQKDIESKVFYMSTNEFEIFNINKEKYKLFRVYDIEGNPCKDIVDLDKVQKAPDGYRCTY